jgi:hypothetical protein
MSEVEEVQEEVKAEEQQLKFDPKKIEEELVRIAQERAEDPVETAASTYRIYLPYYRANLPKMSSRALRRIVKFIVEYPLEKSEIGAASAHEREMMELINTLVQAKFVMILATFNEQSEKIHQAMNSPLTEEEAAQVISDLKAGGASDEDIAALHKQVDKQTQETV